MRQESKQKILLEHLVDLACFVAEDVEEITGKSIDLQGMRVTLYNPEESYYQQRKAEILKTYDDTLSFFEKWSFSRIKNARRAWLSTAASYQGKNYIAFPRDRIFEFGEFNAVDDANYISELRATLAHELTHMQDDQLYHIIELQLSSATRLAEKMIEKSRVGKQQGFFRSRFFGVTKEYAEHMCSINEELTNEMKYSSLLRMLLESNAEFVRQKYKERYPELYPQQSSSPATEPMNFQREDDEITKYYIDGLPIISFAYDHGYDMGMLYQHMPLVEELRNPGLYFARIKSKDI